MRAEVSATGYPSYLASQTPIDMKKFTSIQKVWLVTNTVLWTIAASETDFFFTNWTPEVGGTSSLWPLASSSSTHGPFNQFNDDFSIEEWLLFAIGPWVVVYFLNKAKRT